MIIWNKYFPRSVQQIPHIPPKTICFQFIIFFPYFYLIFEFLYIFAIRKMFFILKNYFKIPSLQEMCQPTAVWNWRKSRAIYWRTAKNSFPLEHSAATKTSKERKSLPSSSAAFLPIKLLKGWIKKFPLESAFCLGQQQQWGGEAPSFCFCTFHFWPFPAVRNATMGATPLLRWGFLEN